MANQGVFSRIRITKEARYFDFGLLFVVLFLLVFGMVMIYSSSSYISQINFSDSMYYLKRQIIAVLAGLVLMIACAVIDYRKWKRFGVIAYGVSALLVIALLFVGKTVKGATRWIPLFAGFNIQPAEVAKLGVILFLAEMISLLKAQVDSKRFIIMALVSTGFMSFLILVISRNLSSAIIVAGIAFLMMFIASNQYKPYVIFAVFVIAIATLFVVGILKWGWFNDYRAARVLAWVNPEDYASEESFQTLQALYAIGSGGFFGKGLGASMQKLGFIPEAQNDMIFSIICEELGLFGAVSVILLFIILIWRCIVIAINAEDLFGSMIVVGVMAHIGIQVVLNIAVVTNTIPNTGISLPFISYGGSSVLFLLIEVGLVLSVSREIRLKQNVTGE